MMPFRWSQVFGLIVLVGSSVLVPAAQPGPIAAAPPEARTDAALLAASSHTLIVGVDGLAPKVLEVTVGQAVTFVNQDGRARTLRIADPTGGPDPTPTATTVPSPTATTAPSVTPTTSPSPTATTAPSATPTTGPAPDRRVFIPLVIHGNGRSLAAGVVPPEERSERGIASPAAETVTLRPGQSIVRTFHDAGNIQVVDAQQPRFAATIAVVPLALNKSGHVVGEVRDWATKNVIAGARVKALGTTLEDVSDAQGRYRLALPPGDYTIVVYANGYTFANRKIQVQSWTPETIERLELVPLDSKVTSVGRGGGTATNAKNNTNVVFAEAAVTSTKAIRLTDLPVDEFQGDFAALPGPFTDGKIPLGFVMFEPDGTHFNAPAVWTIDYDGPLAVGTDVPCYYWLEKEARWGEPVPGKVVDLGNGKKGLRATLPHFSSYGFAAPPPPEPQPPDPPTPPDPSEPPAPDDNPAAPDNGCPKGSQINLMSGELCQTIGTIALPSTGGLPTQILADYRSLDLDTTAVISTSFKQKANSATPDIQQWRFTIAGRTFEGTGSNVNVVWDGKDTAGHVLPPGSHEGTLTAIWTYATGSGMVRYEVPIKWTVEIKRSDLSPFGRGWFSGHDALLIDRGAMVTLLQGDGRQLNFAKEGNRYAPPKGEMSTLVRNANGTWTRSFPNGSALSFNRDGRLARVADRYGNAQLLLYESNGRAFPGGTWGLTTRLRRITDTSGNSYDFAYDSNNWLASISDNTGRVYRYEHDANGNLTAAVDPLGQRETFAYDARGAMTSHTDRRQNKTSYKLDAEGRLVNRTWPSGTVLRMTYQPNETTMVTDRGTALRTQMDAQHNPVLTFNGVYSSTTTYNADLRPETTDRPPQTTLYDDDGNVIAVAAAVNLELERAGPYDQVSHITASDGTNTRYSYDAKGNLIRFTDALGQRYTITYDAHGQPLSITDPLLQKTSITYDDRGLVTRLTDPLGRRFEMTYDAAGNLISSRDPLGRTTASQYDVLGRVTAVVDALNGRTSFSYDANNNLTRVADPTGRALTYAYDALNRPTDVKYPDGGTEKRTYDADGNLVGLLDALGRSTRWQRDAAGRTTRKTLADGKNVTYSYDTLDQITGVNDGTLDTSIRYQPGTYDMPLRERQLARGIPLSVTLDYDYGSGLGTTAAGQGDDAESVSGDATAAQPAQDDAQRIPTPTPPPSPTPATTPVAPDVTPTPWMPKPEPTTPPPPPPSSSIDDILNRTEERLQPDSAMPYQAVEYPNARMDVNGVISSDTTWTAGNVYVINGDLTVAQGATLRVMPGTVVKFAGYYDDLHVNGTLMAEGTAQQPVAFTGLADDAHGGDTNGDGASVGSTDSWSALRFAQGSRGRFKHAFIGYGGGYTIGMVESASSDVVLDYVTLQQSQYYGLYAENASVRVTNSTITGNGNYGLFYNGIDRTAPLVVTDNHFIGGGNQAGRLVLGAGKHNVSVLRNRTTGGRNGFSTAGTLNGTMVWDNADRLPLLVEGDLTVAPTSTLTLKPDNVVKFAGYYDDLFVNGVLVAEGTAQQPVAFTGLSDDVHGGDTNGDGASTGSADSWSALRFAQGSRGRFKHAFIGYGGGYTIGMVESASSDVILDYVTLQQSQYYGLYAESASVRVTNSTITGNGHYGLFYNGIDAAAALLITDNIFRDGGSYAARLVLNDTPNQITFQRNRGFGNARNGFSVAGTINRNLTWSNSPTVPIVVEGDLTVAQGATLTLASGTVVKFAGFYDDLFVNGTLIAEGTAQQSVAFTGLADDAHGGDTNGDGASVGSSDSWSAVRFAEGSRGRIKHAFIGYGGGYTNGMVESASSDVVLDYVTLQQSQYFGLYAENASVRVTNSTITGNGHYGLFYNGIDRTAPLVVTNNSFVSGGNQAGRLVLGAGKHNVTVQGNRTTGGRNGFSTAGTLNGTMVWDNADNLPLLVEGDLTVAPTSTLTLKPDNVVKFAGFYDDLFVNGTLIAEGTAQQPIAFTGLADDAHGGDTNGDGGSVGVTDSWSAVRFSQGSRGRFKHAFIGYGGGYTNGMVESASSDVVLDYVTLQQSQYYGLYAENAGVRVSNSNFVGNGNNAIYNATPAQVIQATDNFWGALSGPQHSSNPGGTGQTVSDGVSFKPWNPAFILRGGGRMQGMEIRSNANRSQAESYTYDELGRMTSLASTGYSTFTLNYEYDRANRLVERQPNLQLGFTTAFDYDAASQTTAITHGRMTGLLLREQYQYDAAGNLTRTVSSRDGTTTFTYDKLNRLTNATGPGLNVAYGYDAAGNRTKAGAVTYTYDAGGRLNSASDGTSYAYDAAGSLVRRTQGGKVTTYVWDSNNQLARINYSNGTWSGYRYDSWGRRVSKRLPDGKQVYYAYRGDMLLQELDSKGRVLASYTYDGLDKPVSIWRGGKTYYYVLDKLGSVLGLTDEHGQMVVTYRYDPWGNILSSTGTVANPWRFTGREYDAESGLYFYRARYYDPTVGRFISRDPIGIAGGPNLYAYVDNNPMMLSDPDGLTPRDPDALTLSDATREFYRKQNLQLEKDLATEKAASQLAAANERQKLGQQIERAANKPAVCELPASKVNPHTLPKSSPRIWKGGFIPPELITMGAAYAYGQFLVQTGQITPQQFNDAFNARFNPQPEIL